MTREEAITKAIVKARKTGKTYYVVYDDDYPGNYTMATAEDMDTYYAGEEAIFCTDDVL